MKTVQHVSTQCRFEKRKNKKFLKLILSRLQEKTNAYANAKILDQLQLPKFVPRN